MNENKLHQAVEPVVCSDLNNKYIEVTDTSEETRMKIISLLKSLGVGLNQSKILFCNENFDFSENYYFLYIKNREIKIYSLDRIEDLREQSDSAIEFFYNYKENQFEVEKKNIVDGTFVDHRKHIDKIFKAKTHVVVRRTKNNRYLLIDNDFLDEHSPLTAIAKKDECIARAFIDNNDIPILLSEDKGKTWINCNNFIDSYNERKLYKFKISEQAGFIEEIKYNVLTLEDYFSLFDRDGTLFNKDEMLSRMEKEKTLAIPIHSHFTTPEVMEKIFSIVNKKVSQDLIENSSKDELNIFYFKI